MEYFGVKLKRPRFSSLTTDVAISVAMWACFIFVAGEKMSDYLKVTFLIGALWTPLSINIGIKIQEGINHCIAFISVSFVLFFYQAFFYVLYFK